MLDAVVWYLLLTVIGLLALPITLRLLRFLPDRGLGVSRHIGLLLASYAFWLLCSLGLLENTRASIALVLVGLGAVSLVIWLRRREELRAALSRIKPALLAEELLFGLAFLGFCLFRAYSPDIAATEKPMEFGFINAILRSRTFPPNDPWLAGYSISYYYLGYVLIAMLTKLSGISSSIAFNLAQATSFALVISASCSIVLNIVLALRSRRTGALDQLERSGWRSGIRYGVVGALFVALLGNLEGVFEFIRTRGWGSAALWRWLDIRNLQTTAVSRTWYPDDGWWWWRATRLLHDRDASGASQEVISEFPFFSYLLGDNHPHVLALPFALLAVALAFNVLLGWIDHRRAQAQLTSPSSGITGYLRQLWPGGALELFTYGLLLGALIFLNTWDYPIYLGLFVLACLVGRLGAAHVRFSTWLSCALQTGAVLLGLGFIFYLPFIVSFRSQAGGIGLVQVKTQWQQFALMFGPFLVIAFSWLVGALNQKQLSRAQWRAMSPWARWCGLAVAVLALLAATLGWWVVFAALLGVGAALVLLLSYRPQPDEGVLSPPDAGRMMIQLMLLLAFGLVLVVEFIYLRDVFNSRMNTVFKFYYQAWVLLALAAAAGLYTLLERLKASGGFGKAARTVGVVCISLLAAGGLLYTVMAVPSRAGGFSGAPTLDGTRFLQAADPSEYAAIAWLQANAPADAVMIEAPGGQYSEYNRLSAYSGVPTLLGWGGHELQWRGNYDIPAAREPDIEAIYTSTDITATRELLRKYKVTYVVLGPNEREKYEVSPVVEMKFDQMLTRVFQQGDLVIYGWLD